MKHILFYTDTPNLGGAEKHMLLLAKHLSLKGVKVSLAYGTYSKLSELSDEFARYCEGIFPLKTLHKHDPRHYTELKKLLTQHHFDLIHLHLWNPGSCRYAFFAAHSTKTPIITTEHDPFELNGFKRWVKTRCLQKTDQTIVVSSENFRLMEDFYRMPKKSLEVVSNGIDIDKFMDNMDKAKLPTPNGAYVITCIAELHPRKGHRYLLEAFKKLQVEFPTVHLILVGKGPSEKQLKEDYSMIPNVHFLGWRKDIPQILRASDILILPSLKEAFGQVILEAMASGATVIATNNGGVTDIIKDGITGYLVPPANSEAIAGRVKLIFKNPTQQKDIQRAALDWVKNNFTASAMANKILEIYKKSEKICHS